MTHKPYKQVACSVDPDNNPYSNTADKGLWGISRLIAQLAYSRITRQIRMGEIYGNNDKPSTPGAK